MVVEPLEPTIGDNIKKIRKDNHLTQEQFGKIAGVSSMAVSQWENHRALPRMGAVQRISDYFGIPKIKIIDDADEYMMKVANDDPAFGELVPSAATNTVPLLGRIAAGQPIEMDEVDNRIEIPEPVISRYPHSFLLTVDGESMNRILPNGCYALINPVDEIRRDNAPYAVCVNGYDATIKRVHRLNHGFELIPDSSDPTFVPKIYDYNDPTTDVITVIGEVVWYTLPYDWSF